MKNILILGLIIGFNCESIFAQTQGTPQGPLINAAFQLFKDNGKTLTWRKLVISQHISPRAIKPGAGQVSEKIEIMYMGHWLDFTDEVEVTGPNSSVTSGVKFSKILEKRNGDCMWSLGNRSIYPNYSGAYVVVEFDIFNTAKVGTHTVRLKRPGLTGRDESIPFYIEVYDKPRIHSIRFKGETRKVEMSYGRLNEKGKVIITGQNLAVIRLDRNPNRLNENALFADIANATVTDTRITFDAKLIKGGIIDYKKLIPANLRISDYPISGPNENLEVRTENSSGGGGSGGGPRRPLRSISHENTDRDPADLAVTFVNSFYSGGALDNNEAGKWGLCPIGKTSTEKPIGNLILKVQNLGGIVSNVTTVSFLKNGNTNFQSNLEFNVKALEPGEQQEFIIPRFQNTVYTIRDVHNVCQRTGIVWNDVNGEGRLNLTVPDGNGYNNSFIIR